VDGDTLVELDHLVHILVLVVVEHQKLDMMVVLRPQVEVVMEQHILF
tara:strand:+ start:875 stop:1015 length:141 start_codon:yes stop_codon:yes gene_type:complete